jgi:amino acid transporter
MMQSSEQRLSISALRARSKVAMCLLAFGAIGTAVDYTRTDLEPQEFRWMGTFASLSLVVGMFMTLKYASIVRNYLAESSSPKRRVWKVAIASTIGIAALAYWMVQTEWKEDD